MELFVAGVVIKNLLVFPWGRDFMLGLYVVIYTYTVFAGVLDLLLKIMKLFRKNI